MLLVFYVAFTSRIQESKSEIIMIDGVYFTKMEQESESESWDPLLFGNEEWEIDSHGGGGNQSPIPWSSHFAPLTF